MTRLALYFLGGVGWSLLLLLALCLLLWLIRRPPGRRDLPALWLVLLFLTLTHYPLPDPATLRCPVALAAPDYMPGNTITHLVSQVRLWGWVVLFDDSTLVAAIMNFALCAAIGLALAWQGRLGNRAIVLFGLGMTLAVEFTQLTGVWGVYPCAYRKFDTDDLILNAAGVIFGLWLGRRRGWAQASRS